ncbi:MAG: endo-1,4-beta-xylanase [Mobilitalea sp.]
MKSGKSRSVWIVLTVLLTMSFIIGCDNKKVANTEVDTENVTESSDDTDAATVTEKPVVTEVPIVTEVPEVTVALEEKIVDGYNIAAATTGIKLKDVYADYFSIGVAINGTQQSNSTIKSNAMAEIFKYHFNSTTFSNLMKPSYLLDQNGCKKNFSEGNDIPAVSFNSAIDGLEFAKANGIKMRGHVLIWHTQTPEWFFREGFDNAGELVDKDTMLKRMESYIQQVMEFTQTEYPGVIYAWDVVNEAIENGAGNYETESGFEIRTKSGEGENPWYKVIGVDYVEKAFEYARKYAAPEVKLFYNDYNTFQRAKTQSIYDLVSYLKEKGLIDGIGMQGYMDLSYPGIFSGDDSFKAALEKFAKLGLEIHITELTIRSDDKTEKSFEKQGERYLALFQLLSTMDTAGGGPANITNVTFFALMDEYLFYNNNTEYHRLFDKELQPKPAFYGVLDAVK